MLKALLAFALIAAPEITGGNLLYPDREDYVGGSGVAVGLFGYQVCTQTADDTTPGVGVGFGPLLLGCNIIVTSDSNTGATAITTFDGVPATVPGTPGSILYVVGPATAANPTTIADAGNFELEYAWSAPTTGDETRVLVLECIAANQFREVTRHNGIRYFDNKIFVEAGNITDFSNSQVVVGRSDTGVTTTAEEIGVVGEAAADGSNQARGVAGYAKTSSANDGTGVLGMALPDATGDTTVAYGMIATSATTHAGGDNVGILVQAANSSTDNHAIEVMAGHVVATLGTDFEIYAEDTTTAAATNAVKLYSGASSNAGDYNSGAVSIYSGDTTTAGDSGAVSLYSGDAPDESGLIDIYTGTSTNAGESSGGIGITTGNQAGATGGSSGSVSVSTGTAAGNAATGDLDFFTGNQTNVGDYPSGSVDLYSGTSATLGDTGAVAIRSGNAADTSGDVSLYSGTSSNTGERTGSLSFYSGNQSHVSGLGSGGITGYTGSANGAAQTGDVLFYSGAQTNAANVPSGSFTFYSGATNTDGNTGSITFRTGVAGAGSGDAGSFIVQTHGTNPRLTIDGAGLATFTGAIDAESYMALGNGSSLAANHTLIIDRDFNDTSDGEALSVTGSQITVTAGTGDIHHTMMNPGSTTFNTTATVHGYATTLNLLEPNIALADGATVTHAATLRIVDAPTEGGTSNWALWVDSGDVQFDGALTVDGTLTASGGLLMGDDLDMDHNDILDTDYYYHQPVTSDIAPHNTTIKAGNAYSQAAVNTGGGDLYLGGGLGSASITCVQATATGTLLTFNSTPSILNVTITEGVEWNCLVDDDTCAAALESYIDTNYSAAFTATAVSNVVWLDPLYTTLNLKVTSADGGGGGTKFAVVDGVEGQILTPDGTAAVPTISFTSDPDSGFYPIAANQVGMAVGGSWHTTFRASGLWTSADVRAGAGAKFHGVDSTEISFPADGDLLITDDATTQGWKMVSSVTDGVLDFYDESDGALVLGGNTFENTLVGATATFSSADTATAAATGDVEVLSGIQSNAGNLASGNVTLASGNTTDTDGDSGDVRIRSGSAAAGAVDAGDILLQVNGANTKLTVAGATGDVTIAEDLVVSGTGPHAFGAGVYDYSQLKFAGNFISGGGDQHAEKLLLDGILTGASGDTQLLSGFYAGASITTQAAAEAITVASQFHLVEPNITIGTATVTNAATLYIQSAPTEGTTRNAALFVEVGDLIMGDGMITHEPEATQSLLAATTITSVNKYNPVVGNGGAVVMTSTPTIAAGSAGDEVCLIGTSDANTVEVQDETTIAGSLLELDGDVDFVLGLHDTICFVYYNSHWVETGRSDNDDD